MASVSLPTASSKRSQSIEATTTKFPLRTKRSSAYDANFQQHLINHHIYPPFHGFPDDPTPPKPTNWEEIRRILRASRGSLSPSVAAESALADFQRKNQTESEGTLMRTVVPVIAGNLNIPNEGHLPFVNLDSITNDTTVKPAPDFFDGAQPSSVDKQVREDLDKIIVPTKHPTVPIAPNLFLDAKSLTGSFAVATRQAALYGAHGALMMHALQNYLQEQPLYDGKAYAFSSTLCGGVLTLYAHHITSPAGPEGRPDYHMTLLKARVLLDDETCLDGLAAFQNLRELAKDYRDRLIDIANARARDRRAQPPITQGDDMAGQEGGSSCLDTKASTAFVTSCACSTTSEAGRPKRPRTPPSPSSTRMRKKRRPVENHT